MMWVKQTVSKTIYIINKDGMTSCKLSRIVSNHLYITLFSPLIKTESFDASPFYYAMLSQGTALKHIVICLRSCNTLFLFSNPALRLPEN